MEGIDQMISQVVSGIGEYGIPYPKVSIDHLYPVTNTQELLGSPLAEISVNVEGARDYILKLYSVIYSEVLKTHWFVYGIIGETLTTGDPEDIQVLTVKLYRGRTSIMPLRLWNCHLLESRMLESCEIRKVLANNPAITGYKWIN